jgi:hypothetical protein
MTWIITAGSTDRMIQVSDRRLTRSDGSLFDDHANKVVCLTCSDASAAISYTGLGFVGTPEKRTDLWLLETLYDLHAPNQFFPQVMAGLEARATDVLSHTAGVSARNDLTFVGAGFSGDGRGIYFSISNTVDASGDAIGHAADSFTGHFWIAKPNPNGPSGRLLAIDGYPPPEAIKQRFAALSESGFFRDQPTGTVIDALVATVREASNDPDTHGLIGENCMSVVVSRDGGFEAAYYPADQPAPILYSPHFLTGQGGAVLAYADVYTRNGWTDSPSAGIPFEQWPDLPVQVTGDGLDVRVNNSGSDDLSDVRVDINGDPKHFQSVADGLSYSSGYVYDLPHLSAGEIVRLPLVAFLNPTNGTSYDRSSERLEWLTTTARLPNGEFGKSRIRWLDDPRDPTMED